MKDISKHIFSKELNNNIDNPVKPSDKNTIWKVFNEADWKTFPKGMGKFFTCDKYGNKKWEEWGPYFGELSSHTDWVNKGISHWLTKEAY